MINYARGSDVFTIITATHAATFKISRLQGLPEKILEMKPEKLIWNRVDRLVDLEVGDLTLWRALKTKADSMTVPQFEVTLMGYER